ncbi:MAG TPA: diguanylate cyclase [Burkholderiaceae bacterium]|jgi:GGDEF domain-containing protein|nr:diguanylate cyclase [Burkholderiaceae bacterium]
MRSYLKDYAFKQEISPKKIAHMTDWMLEWHRRDSAFNFSLVLIDFQDPAALGDALGAAHAMNLIYRIGDKVTEVLRPTDMFCRVQVSSFLVLLPQGAPELILSKIEPVLAVAREDGLDESHLNIGKLSIPTDLKRETTAVELYDRLFTNEHRTRQQSTYFNGRIVPPQYRINETSLLRPNA